MGCPKTRKGRHHVDTTGIAAGARKGIRGFCGVIDQAQLIAQPLNGYPSDENTAFQGVTGLALNAIGHRCQQSLARARNLRSGVGHDETTGAVGALGHARLKTSLTNQRRLLITGDTKNGNRRTKPFRVCGAKVGDAVQHLRQHGFGYVEEIQ